jgi:hypothetical protein
LANSITYLAFSRHYFEAEERMFMLKGTKQEALERTSSPAFST